MELVGNSLKQRNVFVYPPSQKCAADNSTSGEGVCGAAAAWGVRVAA